MSPAEVSEVLRDAFAVHLSRQRVQALLAQERRTVARRRQGGKVVYQLMQAGIDALAADGVAVIFVQPETAFSGIRGVQEILSSVGGSLRMCDPYIDSRTLDFFTDSVEATELQLLTVNVQGSRPFRRDLEALRKELGIPIEVRCAQQGTLHDRYLLDAGSLHYFGASLKDLGKKQSFVIQLGEDLKATVGRAFDRAWGSSKGF